MEAVALVFDHARKEGKALFHQQQEACNGEVNGEAMKGRGIDLHGLQPNEHQQVTDPFVEKMVQHIDEAESQGERH